MGKVSTSPSAFAGKLEAAVKDGLLIAGIKAITATERVPGTKLVRLIVVASAFAELSPTERQNLVWRCIENVFSGDEKMRISVVIALSKKELGSRVLSEMSN